MEQHIAHIQDFYEDGLTVNGVGELKKFLRRRFEEDSNRFIVSLGESDFPNLIVYIRGADAVVYYISSDETTMYASSGSLGAGEDLTFLDYSGETIRSVIELPRESVVASAPAEKCLIDFVQTGGRSDAVRWIEL